jgi:hypothetical protein
MVSCPSYLGVVAAFEERSHPDKSNIVIPHDHILFIVFGKLEGVLEHWS